MVDKIKSRYRIILPIIHFLASFIYERRILIFELDRDVVLSISKSEFPSDNTERIIGYVFAKVFALVFIFFLWKLLFFVIDNKKKCYVKVFTVVGVLGGIVSAFNWPYQFLQSEDNVITFSYALRFWPEYWHSAYSSFIHTACMMVIPFPFFIGVFQFVFFIFVMGYAYKRIYESRVLPKWGRFLLFAFILMPGLFTLISDSYRTEIYTLFCMYVLTRILMDIVDQKKANGMELAGLCVSCGLIAVWRSEGIILGLLSFGVYLIFVQHYKPLKIVCLSIAMVMVFVAFSVPQKLGDKKYYGNDYTFINSFATLRNILDAPGANLSYEGAEADLAAIDEVAPLAYVKMYGMAGYRSYNYENGRYDINQSLASEEAGTAYIKAHRSLALHNPVIYIKTQLSFLRKSLMLSSETYVEKCNEELDIGEPHYAMESWVIGHEDIEEYSAPLAGFSEDLFKGVKLPFEIIDKLLTNTHFYTILLLLIPLFEVYVLIKEIVIWIKKRDNKRIGQTGIFFILLMQAGVIVLVAPAAALVYYHAYYYSSLMAVIIYLLTIAGNKGTEKLNENV